MTKNGTLDFLKSLPNADASYCRIVEFFLSKETEKAVELEYFCSLGQSKYQWFPKRVLGRIENSSCFHPDFAVKRWFLATNRLWYLTK